MCAHPYDHSGPVYSQDGCQSAEHARAGSILAGDSQPSPPLTQTPAQDKPAASVFAQPKTRGQSVSFDTSVFAQPKTRGQSVSFDTVDGRVQGRVKGQVQTGDVAGSERIVSVTDRVVKPSADASQAAEESSPESSGPLPSSGWTARRPTTEVLR
jgi:hypothetical protein